jgi:hypothetical protein
MTMPLPSHVRTSVSSGSPDGRARLPFPKDLIPEGETQATLGAKIWGRGKQGALDRIGTRGADQLRALNLDQGAATRLGDFYASQQAWARGGETAGARVKLMQHIIDVLSGG